MKLKDFIETVLVDIEQGLNAATLKTNRYTYLDTYGTEKEKGVLFDVAVTAGTEASGRIGAEVFSLGAKAEGKITNEEVSRIKFTVMVGSYLPKKQTITPEILDALKRRNPTTNRNAS